jgi:DHA1 family multidrug resistance protein-like MFS transporter
VSVAESPDGKQAAFVQFNWRRNLYVIWIAEFVSIVGFSSAMPFLPYYVQELGVTAPGQVELWSGLLHSMHALTMGIMAPVWGSLADRLGHKLMVERAMFGGALLLGAMAFVGNVQQLLFLRTIQGAVTGTVVACMTLVAAGTPERQRASALGSLQMGVYLGASFGPALGGFVADVWGYRGSFLITGVLLAIGGVLVATNVREAHVELREGDRHSFAEGIRVVLRSPGVLSIFGVRLLIRSAYRAVTPILPLFVQVLVPGEARLSLLMGVVTSASMATSAVGSMIVGRIGGRLGLRSVLTVSVAACAVCYALQAVVGNVYQLTLLRALAGFAMGGILTSVSAALSRAAPEGYQGTVFGLGSTVVSAANAIGPMLGSAVAASWGLRMPFLAAGLGFALAASMLVVVRSNRE